MRQVSYTAAEYTDMVVLYGECHQNASRALRTYRERYEKSGRTCPIDARIFSRAVQRLRDNVPLVPHDIETTSRKRVAFEECLVEAFESPKKCCHARSLQQGQSARTRRKKKSKPLSEIPEGQSTRRKKKSNPLSEIPKTAGQEEKSDPLCEIPEAIVLISRVYHYLQEEYEQLKCVTDCDVRSLSDVLTRTARATGLSALTVTRVLQLEKRTRDDDDDVVCKRQRISHDYYNSDSPIKEESDSDSEQAQVLDNESSEVTVKDSKIDDVQTDHPNIRTRLTFEQDEQCLDIEKQQTEQCGLQIEMKTEPGDGEMEQLVVFHTEDDENDETPFNEYKETKVPVTEICPMNEVEMESEPLDSVYTQRCFSADPCIDATSDVIKMEPSDENHYKL